MGIINLLDLYAKITIDDNEYNEGLERATGKASSFASKIGSGLATAAKVGAAAIGAAATGIAALTKSAVDNYAEYEQLIGGVETLFGQKYKTVEEYAEKTGASLEFAADVFENYSAREEKVLNNAANAYKTAGMSANEYMETVNGFAASLTASLGEYEWQAANFAHVAVTDMADNANKMGTSIEMIQNAYQGFAKQNFTMLDNLKLGYGGTKEEMQRLLEDAEKISGIEYDISSFADIIMAIHDLQEEMGIAGTTAAEASGTISGSLAAMSAAWKNLVTGLGDENANLSGLVSNLAESVATAGQNLMPRIVSVLDGIGQLVVQLAPTIAQAIPQIAEQVLPNLLTAATTLVGSLVTALPTILQALVDQAPLIIDTVMTALIAQLPLIIQTGLQIIVSLAEGIAQSLPELVPTIIDVIFEIVDVLTDPKNLSSLIDASIAIMIALASGLIEALPELIAKVPEIIMNLIDAIVENAPKLLDAAFELIKMLGKGIVDAIPRIWEAGKEVVRGLWEGIQSMASWIRDKVTGFFSGIVDSVKNTLGIHSPSTVFADMGKNMALGLGQGWDKEFSHIQSDINGALDFGRTSLAISTSANTSASGLATGGSFGGTTFSGLTININGANYSDENALAEAIALRLQRMTERRGAAYA